MKTHYLTISVKIEVNTNLELNEAIEQFYSETDYNFSSTDDVKVINTSLQNIEKY